MNRATRCDILAVAMFVALFAAACAQVSSPLGIELRNQTQFEHDWSHYGGLPDNKAFVLAGDVNGVHVSGLSWGCDSLDEAVSEAMTFCEQRRVDRRVSDDCTVYALGDQVVTTPAPPT